MGAVIMPLRSSNGLHLALSALRAAGPGQPQGSNVPLMWPVSPPAAPRAQCSGGLDGRAPGGC